MEQPPLYEETLAATGLDPVTLSTEIAHGIRDMGATGRSVWAQPVGQTPRRRAARGRPVTT